MLPYRVVRVDRCESETCGMNELHGTRCGSGTCGMKYMYREQMWKWESYFVFVLRIVERVFPTHPPIDEDNLGVMPIWPKDTIDRS